MDSVVNQMGNHLDCVLSKKGKPQSIFVPFCIHVCIVDNLEKLVYNLTPIKSFGMGKRLHCVLLVGCCFIFFTTGQSKTVSFLLV